jgi:hypothetical protein
MVLGGRRLCTLSIHRPGRSVSAARVLRPGQPLRLKAAHLTGRSGRPSDRPVAHDPAHRRIAAQPIGVVHILVAGEPSEDRLAQQAAQGVTTILASTCIGECFGTGLGQAHRVVQLAIGQQPRIGGDHAAAKLKQQTAVKIEPQSTPIRFTHRVRHSRLDRLQYKMLNLILESGFLRTKSLRHPGNAG